MQLKNCTKISKKILFITFIVFFVTQGISGFIIQRVSSRHLQQIALDQLTSVVETKSRRLSQLVINTQKDLSIIQLHDAIVKLFNALDLSDDFGAKSATESLFTFLKGVHGTKQQYRKMQLSGKDEGYLLQLNKGEKSKDFDQYDKDPVIAKFVELRANKQDNGILHATINSTSEGWLLRSTIPLVTTEGVRGVMWLEQPLKGVITDLLAEVEQANMVCAITDDKGPVAQSQRLNAEMASGLTKGALPGWVTSQQTIPELGWTISMALPEKDVFKLSNALILLLATSFVCSLAVATAVLGFFAHRQITLPIIAVIENQQNVTDTVAQATADLFRNSHTLSDNVTNIASSIEEISATVEEISSMAQQNAEHASSGGQLIQAVQQISTTMEKSLTELTASMAVIATDGDKINSIVKLIDEIAFQTNLLALNAAVEAARAGEAGAGFAVVADEVRNLAMRSAKAAKDTEELIKGMRDHVMNGQEGSQRTADQFVTLRQDFQELVELVGRITMASREQATGTVQIREAILSVDQATQQTSTTAEDMTASVENIVLQVEEIQKAAGTLTALACDHQMATEQPLAENLLESEDHE